jgi:hypothetical protein
MRYHAAPDNGLHPTRDTLLVMYFRDVGERLMSGVRFLPHIRGQFMNTKVLMVASSLALGLAGMAASFAPSELLRALGSPAADPLPVLIQLLGGLYVAFAITN